AARAAGAAETSNHECQGCGVSPAGHAASRGAQAPRLPSPGQEGKFTSSRPTNRPLRRVSELASGLTRNQMPRKGLWVRIPCPPLRREADDVTSCRLLLCALVIFASPAIVLNLCCPRAGGQDI